MIGGNVIARLQKKGESATNAIGERIPTWVDTHQLLGWLDLTAGDSKYTYQTKLQESTHVFICDYDSTVERNAEDKRLIVNGLTYNVLLIDNPMELNKQLEIYLKFVG